MALLLVTTTLVDGLIAVALVWLAGRTAHLRALARADLLALREGLRADVSRLVADAEHRIRVLDEALATREATLRVLLQIAAASEPRTERPHLDPADVRLLRDLDLTLHAARP